MFLDDGLDIVQTDAIAACFGSVAMWHAIEFFENIRQ